MKAAAYTALAAGHRNIISCDMGGTSFDVGVIRDGRPALTADKEMGYGLPVRVPMIDIHTIGAGGGSIARVNSAGILQVGPESAGPIPAPSATGAGARSRPSPTPTCCSAASIRTGCSVSIGPPGSIASARSSTRRSARTWAWGRTRWPARSCGWPTTGWRGPSSWCRSSAGTTRATSCCSPSAARARCTRWPWPASWRSRGCWCRRGPGSPPRWAAWWPTCATTS